MINNAAPGDAAGRRIASHGRRRGRKLRPGQQSLIEETLPRLTLDPSRLHTEGPAALFEAKPSDIWLEIGFGAGEHLFWQAQQNPNIGLIGCEVFQNGIVTLLRELDQARIDNVRLFTEDARDLLDILPTASIGRIFILFPDPWPKARHHKRRLISPETMDILARVMADDAELRLATDDPPYLRVMLAIACGHPDFEWLATRPNDWKERPADWPQTRYEAKALAGIPTFLRLRRRHRQINLS